MSALSVRLPAPDPAFRWTEESWGVALRCVPLEAIAQHLFTTRQLQLPPLRTLQSGQPQAMPASQVRPMVRPGQAPADAWASALSSVGAEPRSLVAVRQVHGRGVHCVARGRLAATTPDPPEADAIVSDRPGLALAVTVADCVPILMADRATGAAAAVHAGWRGTAAGVAAAAVRELRDRFGTNPAGLCIALGPSIGPDDYEVGEPVMEAFLAAGYAAADVDRWFRRGTSFRLDLWSANRDQLVAAGVRPESIFTCGLSTRAHPAFFDSYRRDGAAAGRTAGIMVVPASPGEEGADRPGVELR